MIMVMAWLRKAASKLAGLPSRSCACCSFADVFYKTTCKSDRQRQAAANRETRDYHRFITAGCKSVQHGRCLAWNAYRTASKFLDCTEQRFPVLVFILLIQISSSSRERLILLTTPLTCFKSMAWQLFNPVLIGHVGCAPWMNNFYNRTGPVDNCQLVKKLSPGFAWPPAALVGLVLKLIPTCLANCRLEHK